MSWEDAWKEGRTGWDAGEAAPSLVNLIASGHVPDQGRALVPGAGSGYDAMALGRHGLQVTAVDLAPTAGERLRRGRDAAGLTEEQVQIEIGDFFEFAPPAPFDVIWDYTFLCALDPTLRPRWAETMDRLLAPGGELITLIFPTVRITADKLGPPFQLTPEQVTEVLKPLGFAPHHLEPLPHELSHEGRRGKEWLGRWRRA